MAILKINNKKAASKAAFLLSYFKGIINIYFITVWP